MAWTQSEEPLSPSTQWSNDVWRGISLTVELVLISWMPSPWPSPSVTHDPYPHVLLTARLAIGPLLLHLRSVPAGCKSADREHVLYIVAHDGPKSQHVDPLARRQL